MKYILTLLIAATVMMVSCSTSKEVTISLTNTQSKAVAFDGHYQVNTDAEVPMTGTTPHEYVETLSKGDQLIGQIWKSDSTNITDTLHFTVLIDGEEQTSLTKDLYIPTQLGGIQFQVSVQ